MSGVFTAVAVGVGGSLYQGREARKAGEAAREATEGTAAAAEALNRERFAEAQQLVSPYIGRSEIASQQLMAEMGLAQPEPTTTQGFAGGVLGKPGQAAPEEAYSPRDLTQIPGYQAAMDESLNAVNQASQFGGQTAYGGRRIQAAGQVGAGVQQSYYNNYMSMLQNLASPGPATNLASLGVGQGATIGQQNIASTGAAQDFRLQGAAGQNAAISDILGGGINLAAGAFAGGYI